MHDINFIRENPTQFDEGLKKRFLEPQSQLIIDLDTKKRELLTKSQDLRSERKNLSSEFSKLNNEEKESLQKKVQNIKNEIVLNTREICGDYSKHRNYHIKKCTGQYIFVIDADEMPKELLISGIKDTIKESGADMIVIPRINIHPGSTREWLNKHDFKVNEMDWINWPDYQPRLYRNHCDIKWTGNVHEQLVNFKQQIALPADPRYAIIHHKDIERQRRQER